MNVRTTMKLFTVAAVALLTTTVLLTSCKSEKKSNSDTVAIDDEEDESMLSNPNRYFDDVKTVTVTTAREFILALKNNRHIIIKGDDALNLTEAINELVEEGELESFMFQDERRYDAGVFYNEEYDGNSLVINNLHDIFIEAKGDEDGILIVEPRYADVLWFNRCKNIAVKGLTMGHTDTGDCSGDVVRAEYCEKLLISNSQLYGCGVTGFEADHCSDIVLRNSEFFGCSDDGISLYQTSNVEVKGCKIYDNGLGIAVEDSKKVVFDDCRFYDNRGQLFRIYDTTIKVKNSFVEHHYDDNANNVEFINSDVLMDYRDATDLPDVEEE